MFVSVEYAKRTKSWIIILMAMMLASCANESRKQTVREEVRNGLKVIHNLKSPAETPFRDLAWPEDLVIGGEEAGEDYLFVRPAGIAVDAVGNIYVLDSRDCTVKKYGPGGGFRARIGRKGQGPGEFESPWGLALDEAGNLYVRDLMAAKIEIFDAQGTPRKTVKGKMWSDFVPLGGGKAVFEYSETLGEESAAKRVLRVAAGTLENVRSVLFSRDQLPFRSIQNKDFRFDIPLFVRWAVVPEGRIYLGTADQYEIRVMTLDGQTVFVFSREYERIPVPADIQTAILKQVGASKLPTMIVERRDFEDHVRYYPIFKSITADEQGQIWVEMYQPEKSAAGQSTTTLFDVFSAEGVLLFSTRIEANLTFRPVFKNGGLYALRLDAKGFPQAVRWKLR
jgi:6-bladed beta-propeller